MSKTRLVVPPLRGPGAWLERSGTRSFGFRTRLVAFLILYVPPRVHSKPAARLALTARRLPPTPAPRLFDFLFGFGFCGLSEDRRQAALLVWAVWMQLTLRPPFRP